MKKKPSLLNWTTKLAAFLLLFSLWSDMTFGNTGVTEAAEQRVTLKIKEDNLTNVIQSIMKQSGCEIVFFTSQTTSITCRNIFISSESAEKALETVLKGTGLTYRKQNGKYVILQDPAGKVQREQKLQEVTISGRVTDSGGEPLPAVNIIIKGTKKGTNTDIDGKYRINVPVNGVTLQFSFLGMETKDVKIAASANTTLNVVLRESDNTLKELTFISTGYQKMNKRDMVGALSTIKADDILRPNYVS